MADSNDLSRAREALVAPGAVDPSLLGAVRDGLLSVPADTHDTGGRIEDDAPRLATRRRGGH